MAWSVESVMLSPRSRSRRISRRSGVSPGQTARDAETGGLMSKRLVRGCFTRSYLMLPPRRFLAVDPQGKALGAAAGLDELGEIERTDREAKLLKRRPAWGARLRITVRPTTTALQLNETASSAETSTRFGTWSFSTDRPYSSKAPG